MIEILEIGAIQVLDEPKPYSSVKLAKTVNILKRFGPTKLVQVLRLPTGSYTLISGRYLLKAYKELGNAKVVVKTHVNLSDEDVVLLRLIDNAPRPLDVVRTAQLLELFTKYDLTFLAGYLPLDKEDLKNLIELKNFNWEDHDNDISHYQHKLF